MIWGSLPYDRPIRHGITQCRAFITAERDGYFRGAEVDFELQYVLPFLEQPGEKIIINTMFRSNNFSTWSLVLLLSIIGSACCSVPLYAQAGLRESLEKLDRNDDGVIDPDEITPLARPYFEQLSRSGSRELRLDLDRPHKISELQEIARRYYAVRNGATDDRRVRVKRESESTVQPFGPQPDQPLVPEFGLAEMKFPYTQDDLDFADRTMSSHDENGDGYIDRDESSRHKWTHRNPFADDLNKDDRLSRLELTQRYARRRLLDRWSNEFRKKDWRTGGEVRASREQEERRDESQWWRRGGSEFWLTASLMGRFDSNKNGRLEKQEAEGLEISTSRIDTNRDGELTREELFAYIKEQQTQAGGSDELPGWFYELDVNRDRQVALHEFATELTNEKLEEFASLDSSGDGLLTFAEVIQAKTMSGGSYRNNTAEVLPPGKTVISEIDVHEDFVIGDVNVQISVTHTNVSALDAYLTGPDGQRIELFTEVGGRGDHFDETIFDDQSQEPITKAQPPFKGAFLPEGLLQQQPGLSQFNGKNANGVWQLVVRGTRSDRFGMLHNWALFIKPQAPMLETAAAAPIGED
jgi:subtilisin-like proprotein convertase family protein